MADKRIFVPYGTKVSEILVEKFSEDAFFGEQKPKTEEEYNKLFLEYRKKLISLAQKISEVAKREYNKLLSDLAFLVQSLHAFYTRKEDLKIFDLEKNIDLLAWYFSNLDKIRNFLGFDLKPKNIESLNQLVNLRNTIQSENIPFFNLWKDIIDFTLEKTKEGFFEIIYPTETSKSALVNSEAFLVKINDLDDKDEVFYVFREFIKLTNKDKSSKLCIFNRKSSLVNYQKRSHLLVLIFNPSVGFFYDNQKKGLIAHVISVDKETKKINEIADYMNDHNIYFPASDKTLKEVSKVIENKVQFLDYKKELEEIAQKLNPEFLNNFILKLIYIYASFFKSAKAYRLGRTTLERYMYEEDIVNSSVKNILIQRILTRTLYDKYVKNPVDIKKSFIDFLNQKESLDEVFDERTKNFIISILKNRLDIIVEKEIETPILKDNLQTEFIDQETLDEKINLIFRNTVKLPNLSENIAFNTELELDVEERLDSDDRPFLTINYTQNKRSFFEKNHEKIPKRVIDILKNSFINQIKTQIPEFDRLNNVSKQYFDKVIRKAFTSFIYKDVDSYRKDFISEISQDKNQINDIICRSICFLLLNFFEEMKKETEKEICQLVHLIRDYNTRNFHQALLSFIRDENKIELLREYLSLKSSSLQMFYVFKSDIYNFKEPSKELFDNMIRFVEMIEKVESNLEKNLQSFSSENAAYDKKTLISVFNRAIEEVAEEVKWAEILKAAYTKIVKLGIDEININENRLKDIIKKQILNLAFDNAFQIATNLI